jgi:hypothetical protein
MTLGALVVAGLLYLATWGPFFLEQARGFSREHSWSREIDPSGNTLRTLQRLASLPLRFITEPMSESRRISWLSGIIYLLPLLLLMPGIGGAARARESRGHALQRRGDLLLWYLLLIAPVLQITVSDLMRGGYGLTQLRYTFLATAPAYALLAALLADKKGWMRHIVPLVVSISCVCAIQRAYQTDHLADWREVAAIMRPSIRDGDVIVVFRSNDGEWRAGFLYMAIAHYSPPRIPVVFVSDPPAGELARRLHGFERIWLLSGDEDPLASRLFPGAWPIMFREFPLVGSIRLLSQPRAATSPTL